MTKVTDLSTRAEKVRRLSDQWMSDLVAEADLTQEHTETINVYLSACYTTIGRLATVLKDMGVDIKDADKHILKDIGYPEKS